LSVVRRPSSVVRHPSSVIHRPSSVVRRPSSVICRPSSVVRRPCRPCCPLSVSVISERFLMARLIQPTVCQGSAWPSMAMHWPHDDDDDDYYDDEDDDDADA
jgi:hypothetical protein